MVAGPQWVGSTSGKWLQELGGWGLSQTVTTSLSTVETLKACLLKEDFVDLTSAVSKKSCEVHLRTIF